MPKAQALLGIKTKFAWKLTYPIAFANPIPWKGQLGLWAPPEALRKKIPL